MRENYIIETDLFSKYKEGSYRNMRLLWIIVLCGLWFSQQVRQLKFENIAQGHRNAASGFFLIPSF